MSSRVNGAARESILAALRARGDEPGEPPEIAGMWFESASAASQRRWFVRMLEAAGGRCTGVASAAELPAALAATPEFASAKRRVSLLPGTGSSGIAAGERGGEDEREVDLAAISHPAELADLDFALLPGVFGVAENGAVWVDGAALPHRSLLVLPQHLGIVLSARALVDHMHAAYERLTFDGPGFGCFVSGPSKTADIEQALVIGAHGARSLCVFLLEAD